MSIGSFADRASREHTKQCKEQKKTVFGLRPSTINASAVMALQDTPELTAAESKTEGSAHAQDLMGIQTKKSIPFWILAPDNQVLSIFNCTVYWLSLPLTVMHTFVLAFGFAEATEQFFLITYIMEGFFGVDIMLNFFTQYKDKETDQTVT